MCFALLDAGRVTRANAAPFFAVLEAAVENPHRLREQQYRTAYRKLFSAAMGKASLFPAWAQPTLQLWEISVLAQLDLFTDDSFQFNRAAKRTVRSSPASPAYKAPEPEGAEASPAGGRERTRWARSSLVGSAISSSAPVDKVAAQPPADSSSSSSYGYALSSLCPSRTSRPCPSTQCLLTTSVHPASFRRLATCS